MVICLRAGTRSSFGLPSSPLVSTPTFISLKAGMYFEIGSSIESLPCSASIMTATEVIGLLIE